VKQPPNFQPFASFTSFAFTGFSPMHPDVTTKSRSSLIVREKNVSPHKCFFVLCALFHFFAKLHFIHRIIFDKDTLLPGFMRKWMWLSVRVEFHRLKSNFSLAFTTRSGNICLTPRAFQRRRSVVNPGSNVLNEIFLAPP
jgi:hypothetical protein